MSIRVIRSGILDTLQDAGRIGYRHLGINPGGVMDHFALQVANRMIGNDPGEAVLEFHFPAPVLLFEKNCVIMLCGADFGPHINQERISINSPIYIPAGDVLRFEKHITGARAYLAIKGGFNVSPWLNSKSTNLKASTGGFNGRALKKDDVLHFNPQNVAYAKAEQKILPYQQQQQLIGILPGPEWNWISDDMQRLLCSSKYQLLPQSNRMGFWLQGPAILQTSPRELVSSPVNFGTIQLLPEGQLIILMADHQTTGGYPRIANVIAAHLPFLAQQSAGDQFGFQLMDIAQSEELYAEHVIQV